MKSKTQERIFQAALQLFARDGKTDINISELASLAGMARGTIYNNLGSLDGLFEKVATFLTAEMNKAIESSMEETLQKTCSPAELAAIAADPARRIAVGTHYYLQRTHEEPLWASFIIRFGISHASLNELWEGQPAADIENGLASGRFKAATHNKGFLVTMMSSNVLAAMHLVREGQLTWREAAAQTTAYILKALGIEAAEAEGIAQSVKL